MSIVLIQCNSSDNSINQQPKNYTNIDLEGHWTLNKVECTEEMQSIAKYKAATKRIDEFGPYEDASYEIFLEDGKLTPHYPSGYFSRINKDWVIDKDSIHSLNYPLQLGKSYSYVVHSDSLKIENNRGLSINLSYEKDTIYISYLDFWGLYITETYQKVIFKDSVLNILKRYKTNFPLLAGTWELMTDYNYNNDGSEYILNFPFDIPDTLVITEEELISTLHTDRSYNMLTNGKKLKYFLGYDDTYLQLTPDNWYKEENPFIHFSRVIDEK
jgi:hypothetical protein